MKVDVVLCLPVRLSVVCVQKYVLLGVCVGFWVYISSTCVLAWHVKVWMCTLHSANHKDNGNAGCCGHACCWMGTHGYQAREHMHGAEG